MGKQRPRDSRVLIGQRHRCYIRIAAVDELGQPVLPIAALSGSIDHGPGAVNQQRSQVRIATLAHPEQRRLASAGMLTWDEAQAKQQAASRYRSSLRYL